MEYPKIDKELIGKKVVGTHSKDTKVYTVVKVGEFEVEAYREVGGSTWAYFGVSGIRLATPAEIHNDGRFEGSCPHRYRSYLEKIQKQNIPHEYQEYKTDFSKPSMMSINAWVCDWCGQHIDRDTDKILKPAYRW
jgi:hypothetical protein